MTLIVRCRPTVAMVNSWPIFYKWKSESRKLCVVAMMSIAELRCCLAHPVLIRDGISISGGGGGGGVLMSQEKPKFHYADFPVTSATNSRTTP